MNDDIVARLREEGFVTHIAQLPRESKLLREAADEIERLRLELAIPRDEYAREWKTLLDRIEHLDILEWIRAYAAAHSPSHYVSPIAREVIVMSDRRWIEAADEIERLRELLGNPEQLRIERSEEIERLREECDKYRRLYLRGLAFHYKAKGVVWRTYVNPQRSDGLFVAGVGSLDHPMQAIPRGVKSVECQLPHVDAEELVVLLNELSVQIEEEPQ